MDKKRYTSGEIAAAAGLTIRAVQYYDNIGLFPSSGRTEGGRRYYTQDDLVRIEQIVFYRSLDFPLEQIRKQLLPQPSKQELLDMFKTQRLLLLQKMEHLHTSFATIGAMSDMLEAGREPPFALLLRFLSALPGDDIFSQAQQLMTGVQQQALSQHFQDIEPVQLFYHRWKELLIEAVLLLHEDAPPQGAAAQALAKRWWETILSFTGGDPKLIAQLSELRLEQQLPTKNADMLDAANRFLERAFEGYASRNGLSFSAAEEPEDGRGAP